MDFGKGSVSSLSAKRNAVADYLQPRFVVYMGGRKKRYYPVSLPEPLFPFLAFGGDPLGGCDRLFRGLADAFGRFALAFAVLVASPCRAFVEFHKCRPVETFVRHLAEIWDVRVGLGLGFQLPARR